MNKSKKLTTGCITVTALIWGTLLKAAPANAASFTIDFFNELNGNKLDGTAQLRFDDSSLTGNGVEQKDLLELSNASFSLSYLNEINLKKTSFEFVNGNLQDISLSGDSETTPVLYNFGASNGRYIYYTSPNCMPVQCLFPDQILASGTYKISTVEAWHPPTKVPEPTPFGGVAVAVPLLAIWFSNRKQVISEANSDSYTSS